MIDFKGNLRRVADSNLNTPLKDMSESDFQQQQKMKYERSEHSYVEGNGNTKVMQSLDRSIIAKDSKEIYDNLIPINIKSFERDDYSTFLRAQIYVLQEKTGKSLKINLTDDSNHLFLYTFYLKESEYSAVRIDQSINVDFSGYPEMIVQHFGLFEVEREHAPKEGNYFHSTFLIKKGGQACLNALETNKFKTSQHMSLRFRMATDEQLKTHLAEKLSSEKSYNEELRINNSKLEDLLNSRMIELESLSARHKQQTEDRNKDMETLTLTEQRKLNEYMEKSLAREGQLTKEYEADKRKTADKYDKIVRDLTDRLAAFQQNYEQEADKCRQLESRERELTSKYTISEKELAVNIKQLEQVRRQYKQLQTTRFAQEKENTELKCKVQSLSRQLQDKNTIIQSNKELKDTANSQVQVLEEQLQEHKTKSEKLLQELTKATVMIDELREKYQKKKEKVTQSKEIIKNQEKAVQELQRKVIELERATGDLKRLSEDLKNKNSDLQAKKKQCEKRIEDDNALITHLNKQLTERAPGFQASYMMPQPSITRYPLNMPMSETQTSYQVGTSRLRVSPSPLERSDRVQPQVKKYVPMQTQLPLPTSFLSQQKDPEETIPTMTTEPSAKIRPIRYRPPE